MNITYINWPGTVIILVLFIVFGLVALISPFTIARIMVAWPKFIFSKLFEEDDIPSTVRDAINLIDDRDAYNQRFWYQILMFRIGGSFALLASCCLMSMMISAISK